MRKFYKCEICGNIIGMIDDSGVIPHCCNVEMTELTQQTEDMGHEKHEPVVETECVSIEGKDCSFRLVTVKVGDEPHPMTREHHIQWILLETTCGSHRIKLNPIGAPEATLMIHESEKILAVYAYCNVHGLWVNKAIDEK